MKAAFGFDVFVHSFDKPNGYSIYEWNGHRILILQFKRLPDHIRVIWEFLNLSEFELSKDNVGEMKWYGLIYKRFIERIRFDDAF